jgi:hypothetical protein
MGWVGREDGLGGKRRWAADRPCLRAPPIAALGLVSNVRPESIFDSRTPSVFALGKERKAAERGPLSACNDQAGRVSLVLSWILLSSKSELTCNSDEDDRVIDLKCPPSDIMPVRGPHPKN